MTWVYQQTEPQLWTVGFYAPDGSWHTDSDHSSKGSAARRVAMLNGSSEAFREEILDELYERLVDAWAAARMPYAVPHARRDSLLDAYVIVTGKDPETVYETVQETLQARHERHLAQTEA